MKFLCIPSPVSKRRISFPRAIAIDESPRSSVGEEAEVPRKMILRSIQTLVGPSLR